VGRCIEGPPGAELGEAMCGGQTKDVGATEWSAVGGGVARQALYATTLEKVRDLFARHNVTDPAHSVDHVIKVTESVQQAAASVELPPEKEAAVVLAALLHEADDVKLFGTVDDANAKAILREVAAGDDELQAAVLEVVGLVSARKNKNAPVPAGDEWKLLVRDADRLEAIGEVGIARCYAYNKKVDRPLFCAATPRCVTVDEVWRVATPERFAAYDGGSLSMMDHYYDKLLHLDSCGSGSAYLQRKLEEKRQVLLDFVLAFGRSGLIDVEQLEVLAAKHCP